MKYKNLEIVPGLPVVYRFELLDDDFLKLDLTGYTFKFEVFDEDKKIVLTRTIPDSTALGLVTFSFNSIETSTLHSPLYTYRLIATTPGSFGTLTYKGFVSSTIPGFNQNDTGSGSSTILPDGTIYATGPITLVMDQWYATSSFYRFLSSGIGVLVIDGRDLNGTTWPNRGVFYSTSPTATRWIPDLAGMTAFRIKLVSGSCTVRYLP